MRHHEHLILVDVRNHLGTHQCAGRHWFHPDGLPDARRTGVHALELLQAQVLLAGGLLRRARVAIGMHHERVFLAVGEELRHVNGERRAASEVATGQTAIDVDLGIVVHGTEVQQDVLAEP